MKQNNKDHNSLHSNTFRKVQAFSVHNQLIYVTHDFDLYRV